MKSFRKIASIAYVSFCTVAALITGHAHAKPAPSPKSPEANQIMTNVCKLENRRITETFREFYTDNADKLPDSLKFDYEAAAKDVEKMCTEKPLEALHDVMNLTQELRDAVRSHIEADAEQPDGLNYRAFRRINLAPANE